MSVQIQIRRGASSEWLSVNPVLAQGEPGLELDTGKIKIGNSASTWTQLSYANALPSEFLSLVAASANFLTKVDAAQLYIPITASGPYLTEIEASALYIPISASSNIVDNYIPISSSYAYLTRNDAENTYIPISSSAEYLTEAEAQGIYVPISSSANIVENYIPISSSFAYLTRADAESTYIPITSSATYLTESEAEAIYVPITASSGIVENYIPISSSYAYLTRVDAESTYIPISSSAEYLTESEAAGIYVPISASFNIRTGLLEQSEAANVYAPLSSASLTGVPVAPTATAGTNTKQIATTEFVRTEITNLVDSAPGTLDTLNELAAALGDDPNFATSTASAIGERLTIANASATYLSMSDAQLTYIPITASAEYLTELEAQAVYVPISASSNIVENYIPISSSYAYLTRSDAESTYIPITASSEYLTESEAADLYIRVTSSAAIVEDYLRLDTASATYATSLAELNDVNVSSAIAGEFLKYDGFEWVSASVAAGGGGGSTVSFSTISASVYTLQLSDVGKLLEFDSTASVTVLLPKDSQTLIPTGSKINISKTVLGAPINLFALPDLITWTTQNANIDGPSWIRMYDVAYGNNTWVIVGDYGQIRTSTDTISWTTRTSNAPFSTSGRIESVAYGNGSWVAGAVGSVLISTDTITWTSQSSLSGNRVYAVAYGNGRWVVGGQQGQMRSSTDTVTWTTVTSNFGNSGIVQIVYGNGIWVAGGYNGQVRRSTDGITWTTSTVNNPSARYFGIAYGDNKWLLGGAYGNRIVESSTDGITWITHASTPSYNINSITYGNGWWFAGTYTPGLFSTDSITWVTLTDGSTNIWRGTSFENNVLIGVGGPKLVQTGVANLEPVKLGSPDSTYTITDRWSSAELIKRGPNNWVISDKFESYVRASSASVTFLPRTTACATYLSIVNATASYSPRFISTNAQSGTSYTLALSDMNRLMEFSGTSASVFIPLGEVVNMPIGTKIDVLQTSASGQINFYGAPAGPVWTSLVTNVNFSNLTVRGIEFGSGSYVAMNDWYPTAYISTDLTTWRTGGSPAIGSSGEGYALAYGNGRWVSGHRFGYISNTTDGVTWTTSTSNLPANNGGYVTSIAYGNGTWVATANSHVRSSTDSITWTTVTSTGLAGATSAHFGSGSWVLVFSNTAFRSIDTVTWTSVNTGVSWSLNSVAYGNGLWVAGGNSGTITTSTDTVTWTSRTSNFGNTNIFSVAYGNGLWIASSGYTGGLRASTDGITWATQTPHFVSNRRTYVGYENGVWLNYGYRMGIGTSTQQLFGPVILNSSGNKRKLSGQWSAATLIKRANNTWVAIGDLSE